MIRVAVALFLLVVLAACDGAASVGSSSVLLAQERPAAVAPASTASGVPPSATTTQSPSEPPASKCPLPLQVSPRTLAVSWPQYVGRRVSFVCRPARRIDFTRTLVVAGGAKFVVTSAPEATPCGATTSIFTVMSPSTVLIAGRTALPELLLEDGDDREGCSR